MPVYELPFVQQPSSEQGFGGSPNLRLRCFVVASYSCQLSIASRFCHQTRSTEARIPALVVDDKANHSRISLCMSFEKKLACFMPTVNCNGREPKPRNWDEARQAGTVGIVRRVWNDDARTFGQGVVLRRLRCTACRDRVLTLTEHHHDRHWRQPSRSVPCSESFPGSHALTNSSLGRFSSTLAFI